jgi:hypothetical protein
VDRLINQQISHTGRILSCLTQQRSTVTLPGGSENGQTLVSNLPVTLFGSHNKPTSGTAVAVQARINQNKRKGQQ